MGKCAGRRGGRFLGSRSCTMRGWRPEMMIERDWAAQVINQRTAKSPCQEHTLLLLRCQKTRWRSCYRDSKQYSLRQLVRAIKNNVRVIGEDNASHGPKAFQIPMIDDVLVHLCNMRDGVPVLSNAQSPPPPPYPQSYPDKEISPCLLMSP